MSDRYFVKVPGENVFELPPLLLRGALDLPNQEEILQKATQMVEEEDLIPNFAEENEFGHNLVTHRRMDLAMSICQRYKTLCHRWNWGDGVLYWIGQCQTTFQFNANLRTLMPTDIWPHAGNVPFVELLNDKAVMTEPGISLEEAVGLRLAFRRLPKIEDFSDQFLFHLYKPTALTAFKTWAELCPKPIPHLPPDRFLVNTFRLDLPAPDEEK